MPAHSHHRTFADLARDYGENRDWQRSLIRRPSAICLIAPHGGNIEGGTSELAKAIAGNDFSLYTFDGLMPRGNEVLHLSSRRFDEPMCLDLLASTPVAVAIHGCAGAGPGVYVGGLHDELRLELVRVLRLLRFDAIHDLTGHSGTDPANVCNRCSGRRGIQLEITRGLRAEMFAGLRQVERRMTTPRFIEFVFAVRKALLAPATKPPDLA